MGSYQEQARASMQEAALRISATNGRTLIKDVIARSPKSETRGYIRYPNRRIDSPQWSLDYEEPEAGVSTFRIGSNTPYDGGVSLKVTFNENPGRTAVGAHLVFATGSSQEDHDSFSQHAQITRSHDIARILRIMRNRDPKEILELLGDAYKILNPDDSKLDDRRNFAKAMRVIGTSEHEKNVFRWYVDAD